MSWILDRLAAQRATSGCTVSQEDLDRAEVIRAQLSGISARMFHKSRPSRAVLPFGPSWEESATGFIGGGFDVEGGWSEQPNSGFSFPPMVPSNLLDDPEADKELDAIATAFLAAADAKQEEITRRKAASRMAATRAKRAAIISDLLGKGLSGPQIFRVITESDPYALAVLTDPTWTLPAWVADEIRRQSAQGRIILRDQRPAVRADAWFPSSRDRSTHQTYYQSKLALGLIASDDGGMTSAKVYHESRRQRP